MAGNDDFPDDPEFPGVDHPFEVPEGLTPPDPSEFAAGPPPGPGQPPSTGQPPYSPPPSGQPPSGPTSSGPPQFPPPDQGLGAPPTGFPAQGAVPPPGYGTPPPGNFAPPSGFPAPSGGPVMVEKKKRGCLFWGLIAGGILVLLFGGCTVLLLRAGSDATAAGNDFLGLVRDGNYEAAANSKAQQTPSGRECDVDASDLAEDFAGLTDFTIFGIGFGGEGGVGGEVTINGTNTQVALALVEEGDVWRVCAYDVGDNAEVEIGGN